MELMSLMKTIIFYLSSFKDAISPAHNEPVNRTSIDAVNMMKNCTNQLSSYSRILVPYDFDCSMPYPPYSDDNNSHQVTHEKIAETQPPPPPSPPHVDPIHTIPKLPGSIFDDVRYENLCMDKIHDVYSAIKDFNNYNYEKNQEIQYLAYNEQQKHDIIEQSKQKKAGIEIYYNKMHKVCAETERHREKLTLAMKPQLHRIQAFFAQPSFTPSLWYNLHNLETVVQQLFTPKLRVRTFYDDKTKTLKMHRMFAPDITRKRFLPLPTGFPYDGSQKNDETINTAIQTVQKNPSTTEIDMPQKKAITIQQFNSNILDQYTSNVSSKEISDWESRLARAVEELQENTVEMERNRVIPELIGVYNAENEAHKMLPQTKFITKLIGTHNKRVITAFNPSEAIQMNGLIGSNPKLIDAENSKTELTSMNNNSERKNLDEPLRWDQNWTWDY